MVDWMKAGPANDGGGMVTQTLLAMDSVNAAFKACKLGKTCGPIDSATIVMSIIFRSSYP